MTGIKRPAARARGGKKPNALLKKGAPDKRLTDIELITQQYNQRAPSCIALAEEVEFCLKKAIDDCKIKIHSIETRVKELSSTLRKVREKEYPDLDRVRDMVGGRVVCLFRPDLGDISKIIHQQFQVDEFDDKSISDPAAFGYMSLHFQCRLKQDYSGPRYDYLKSITFELQVRTIGMHAWSVVQHYLEYKDDWDVPTHLKKDINALSALYHIADSQFEAVYKEKISSSGETDKKISENRIDDQAINLDSLEAYLRSRFPDRSPAKPSTLSELVGELGSAGYLNLGEVARDVDRADRSFAEYEEKRQEGRFHASGALRISLAIASERYREMKNYAPGMFKSVLK